MTLKSPVQIFINGKFFAVATEVEIKQNSPDFRAGITPNQNTGVVVNIKKEVSTQKEKEERAKEKSKGDYNEFFNRMVNAEKDPDAHLPIE